MGDWGSTHRNLSIYQPMLASCLRDTELHTRVAWQRSFHKQNSLPAALHREAASFSPPVSFHVLKPLRECFDEAGAGWGDTFYHHN